MRRLPALLAVIWLAALCSPAHAESRKLLIAVMDKVSWHDLRAADVPALDDLMRHGQIALMVTRAAGGPEGAGSYLTIGAGSRASAAALAGGPPAEGYAFDAAEDVEGMPAGRAYEVQTGWPRLDAAVVHLGIGRLLQENLNASYPLRLGLLGEALRRAGKRVACVGNADTRGQYRRDLVALGMDENGRVALGDVGRDLLRRDASLPYGNTLDPARLEAAVARVAPQADVIIVELGETSRAAAYADLLPPERADALRLQAAARADRLLAHVLRHLARKEWAVLVVTPSPPPLRRDQPLAPLTPIIFSTAFARPGLLTSSSTRRPGLVANTDVAATVLDYFGLPVPPDSVGRPMTAVTANRDPRKSLYRSLARHDVLETARRQVLRAFGTFAAIVLWIAALALFVGGLAPRWACALTRAVLLGTLAAPLAALLVATLPVTLSSPLIVASVVALAPLLALLAGLATRWQRADAAIAAALTVALVADLFAGQRMLQWSALSYSASAGARFYGIGNEYAGGMLGAALVAAAAALESRRLASRAALAAGLIAIAALVGWPRLGANFGMALAAAVGLGVFCLYLWRERPSWRDIGALAALAIVLGGAVVAADVLARGGASHIGLLIGTIRAEGWRALTDTIVRKLSMNWMLMRTSLWTDVAAAALTVFGVAAIIRPADALQAASRWRWLVPTCLACLAGAAASLLLNDSGIVAAAFVLCYGAGSLAYLALGEPAAKLQPIAAEQLQPTASR